MSFEHNALNWPCVAKLNAPIGQAQQHGMMRSCYQSWDVRDVALLAAPNRVGKMTLGGEGMHFALIRPVDFDLAPRARHISGKWPHRHIPCNHSIPGLMDG
jgi:hypothetical protein